VQHRQGELASGVSRVLQIPAPYWPAGSIGRSNYCYFFLKLPVPTDSLEPICQRGPRQLAKSAPDASGSAEQMSLDMYTTPAVRPRCLSKLLTILPFYHPEDILGVIWSWLLRGSIRPLRTRRRASHCWSTSRFSNRASSLSRPNNAYSIIPHYPPADTVGRDSSAMQRSASSSPKGNPRGRCYRR